jgi:hypothetical protein
MTFFGKPRVFPKEAMSFFGKPLLFPALLQRRS